MERKKSDHTRFLTCLGGCDDKSNNIDWYCCTKEEVKRQGLLGAQAEEVPTCVWAAAYVNKCYSTPAEPSCPRRNMRVKASTNEEVCGLADEPTKSTSSPSTSSPTTSSTTITITDATCFSGVATVQVVNRGIVAMKDLKVGDRVLTKGMRYEPVYAFGRRVPGKLGSFLQIHTRPEGQNTTKVLAPLEPTEEHLLYLRGKDKPVRASSLKVGDVLKARLGPMGM